MLIEIWQQLLGIKHIGIRDNFFELGGYSLLAIRLLGQIEKRLSKDLPLATIFRAPTIEQLASIIRQREPPVPWSSLVAIKENIRLMEDMTMKLTCPPKIGPLKMRDSCKITTGGSRSENEKVFGGAGIPGSARG